MSTPLFARKTTHQLIEEREQVLHAMHPLNLDTLRRLRAVDAATTRRLKTTCRGTVSTRAASSSRPGSPSFRAR